MLLFVVCWLMLYIGIFIECYFELEVELFFSFVLVDFVCEEVDVVLCMGLGNYLGLYVEKLFDDVFFLICSFVFNGGCLLCMLVEMVSMILLCSEGEVWKLWFDVVGVEGFVELCGGLMFQDLLLLLQVVVVGQGIVLICLMLVFNDLLIGCVVCLFEMMILCLWNYYFVCLYSVLQMFKMQVFCMWLLLEIVVFKFKLVGLMNDNVVCLGYVFKG